MDRRRRPLFAKDAISVLACASGDALYGGYANTSARGNEKVTILVFTSANTDVKSLIVRGMMVSGALASASLELRVGGTVISVSGLSVEGSTTCSGEWEGEALVGDTRKVLLKLMSWSVSACELVPTT